ncbi:MAG: UDP-4-amino-4,6-dideoxy-N-acetyl-beta-L-altrosamine transaminase [Pseudobdellovibrionaceae bacterium]
MQKIIPYGRQSLTDADKKAVLDVLEEDFLTQGPHVEKFEQSLSGFVGSTYAVAVTNGTAALHLAAMALGVQKGDKVLVTTNTFVASANCIRYCGGEVEFVDIDPKNFCIDLDLLEEKINKAPAGTYKGLVVVDFAGWPVNMQKVRSLADRHQLWILEDSCHALGAAFLDDENKWSKAGSCDYADIAIFSFHPVKHIATGEGGMITTKKQSIYNKLKLLRTHGITKDPALFQEKSHGPWYYEMQELGYNYRISDILCALGHSQMQRIQENLARRKQIAGFYFSELINLDIKLPFYDMSTQQHAFHLFVIQTDKRNDLYEFLKKNNIYLQVHYMPVHTQPYYVERYGTYSLPCAEKYYSKALSLPMYHGLQQDDQARVIETLKKFYA